MISPLSNSILRRVPTFLILLFLLVNGSAEAEEPRVPEFIPHSYSASRQFLVYHEDANLRGAVCGFAEDSKDALLRLLRTRDDWKLPVIIYVHTPAVSLPGTRNDSSRIEVLVTEAGLQAHLHVVFDRDFDVNKFRRTILEAVLMELSYRAPDSLRPGERFHRPPEWLLTGLSEYLQGGVQERFSELFAQLIAAEQIIPVETVIYGDVKTMDNLSRSMHRAHCFALVKLLIDLPNGRRDMLEFIQTIRLGESGEIETVMNTFTDLAGSPESLVRWWNLGVARVSLSGPLRRPTVRQTEEKLRRLLQLSIPSGNGQEQHVYSIEEFQEFVRAPGAEPELRRMQRDLIRLGMESHPLYRPVIAEYQEIASLLTRRRTRGLENRLQELAGYRLGLIGHMREIEDFMNWFEATQLATETRSFDGYLETARRLENLNSGRDDRITRYLDRLEQEFNW